MSINVIIRRWTMCVCVALFFFKRLPCNGQNMSQASQARRARARACPILFANHPIPYVQCMSNHFIRHIGRNHISGVFIYLQRETEEKARQPETKLSAIAQTRHTARLRDAKRSRTRNPKPTHGARNRPKQPQPRARRARASEPGWRHSSRRTRPTDTGTRCPGKGQR
jgi:hypothetical protein